MNIPDQQIRGFIHDLNSVLNAIQVCQEELEQGSRQRPQDWVPQRDAVVRLLSLGADRVRSIVGTWEELRGNSQ